MNAINGRTVLPDLQRLTNVLDATLRMVIGIIGIEAENSGLPGDPWPDVQIEAYQRGVAAILAQIGADAGKCCGHKEYALPQGRKTDPSFDMPAFRSAVGDDLLGKAPPAPIPAVDAAHRATLRRGDSGPQVTSLQQAMGIAPSGTFGADMEKTVRAAQRAAGLVPDGIVGPKSWSQLAPVPAPPAPPAGGGGAADLPPADSAAHPAHVSGGIAFGPDGKRFASQLRGGFYTLGITPAASWLAGPPPPGISPSAARVVAAACDNEGGLEAVNSYDDAFLSVGICQWTAGAGDEAGEIAALLRRVRAADAAAFAACFGDFGLTPVDAPGDAASFLRLGDDVLDIAGKKQVLRGVEWAWRFWRAGHHPVVRQAQVLMAADRTHAFLDREEAGHRIGAWVSSELGVALLLDEHINRPGHVPATLVRAIAELAPADRACEAWTDAQERALLDRYLALRAQTDMTSARARGEAILARAAAGRLSAARGSFGG